MDEVAMQDRPDLSYLDTCPVPTALTPSQYPPFHFRCKFTCLLHIHVSAC